MTATGPTKARILSLALAMAIGAAAIPSQAPAVGPNEALADPALEARARELFKELRCLVCQNQSIDDSDADLARDLRVLVRERLRAGDSDEQVIAFLTRRYGDFVLLRPPVKGSTLALWTAPFAILILGGIVIALRERRRAVAEAPALSEAERARLTQLLGSERQEEDKR